ncbi:hypothetical protein [Nitratireductor sp. ZSWI3]|uniref:hypothetical protein n=1 Tax=Nitratireductor sp. ZSWI3 TaxID=2966359 RepID=UPI00215033FF|nr:hypothetical protein [Nitratireductor sp. ZSWI3]MCR4268135.1 hypothetical protein [Nitratireductor sp. ZSWI3]
MSLRTPWLAPAGTARSFLFLSVVQIALTGCLGAGPRSMLELSNFDPFRADPRGIAVAVKTDRHLHLVTGDVRLRVAFASPDAARRFDESFILAVSKGRTDSGFPDKLATSEHLITARIADADIARYEAVQKRARAVSGADRPDEEGTLAVSMEGGCRTGPVDERAVTLRTYLRARADGAYFPLTGTMSLEKTFGSKSVAGIPPCDGKSANG